MKKLIQAKIIDEWDIRENKRIFCIKFTLGNIEGNMAQATNEYCIELYENDAESVLCHAFRSLADLIEKDKEELQA